MTFTEQKPTVPGAYWWRSTAIGNLPGALFLVEIYESGGRLFAWRDGKAYTDNVWQAWVGEWSSRLVPVDEVEKAYREGWNYALSHGSHSQEQAWLVYRRVVEGREGCE